MTAEPNADFYPDAVGQAGSIAIVGLACRFPDADDIGTMLDLIASGRRAFRSVAPHLAGSGTPARRRHQAAAPRLRAAIIEDWRFDRGVSGWAEPDSADDPARMLAVDTAARALASAGFAGGAWLPARRIGVFMGHVPAAGHIPAAATGAGPKTVAAPYLAGLAIIDVTGVDDSSPPTAASAIRSSFGLGGRAITVAAGGASSLAAVAAAGLELANGDIDIALAGGVDVGLGAIGSDPGALVRSGVLASGDMRIYDKNPTGYLPGEGCGVVLLMRTADAIAAKLPIHAEIAGWGVAEDGPAASTAGPASGLLAAMCDAYGMAQVDPLELALIEGCGSGIAATDEAELAALAALRAGAGRTAVLGSIAANIGNTHAAAGAASLIKTVVAIANGVLPPATGIRTPHPLLIDGGARLRWPEAPEPWPGLTRHAGVSAIAPGEVAVHLVLQGPSVRPATPKSAHPRLRGLARSRARAHPEPGAQPPARRGWGSYPAGSHYPFAYLVQGPDRAALARELSTIAELAPQLSDAQAQDLAVGLSRAAAAAGPAGHTPAGPRVGIVATSQEDLSVLAAEAVQLLPHLGRTLLTRPGLYAADFSERPQEDEDERADEQPSRHGTGLSAGRVALLLACQPAAADLPQHELSRMLRVLARLNALGVEPAATVGHGAGEIAGLVWAGCTSQVGARTLIGLRSAAVADPGETRPGQLSALIEEIAGFDLRTPGRLLLSGRLGTVLADRESIVAMLSAELLHGALTARLRARPRGGAARPAGQEQVAARIAGQTAGQPGGGAAAEQAELHLLDEEARLGEAVRAAAADADLLLQTGVNWQLARAVRRTSEVPVVSIDGDPADDRRVAHAAAALFAIGALARPDAVYAGRPSRPIGIRSDQVSVAGQSPAAPGPGLRTETGPAEPAAPEPSRPEPAASATCHPELVPEHGRSEPAGPVTCQREAAEHQPGGPDRAAPEPSQAPATSVLIPGVTPWVHCFADRAQPLPDQTPADQTPANDDAPWRVLTGGCGPLERNVREIFPDDPRADRTLAVLGSLDDAGTMQAALGAARDAVRTGRLVAISHGAGLAGFWATLHAEQPQAGITVLRVPLTADGLRAASRFAVAEPGEYREIEIGADAVAAEPVMVPLHLPGGAEFPFGTQDVALISRACGPAGLALAQVLACTGAAVALIGSEPQNPDSELIAEFGKLRAAGARVSLEAVDMTDRDAVIAAVERIESQLGRITALCHATDTATHCPVTELSCEGVHDELRLQAAVLDQLAAAVGAGDRGVARRPARLRYIITFGSVIGRYGLAGEGTLALATGALAEQAQRLAATIPGCRALQVDWPGWTQPWLGEPAGLAAAFERAGIAPMPVAEASRLLLKLLTTENLPARLAVHGRVGRPAPPQVERSAARGAAGRAGRFIERVLLHCPGIELIAEATLSRSADPYLADYRVDGVPVLPPTMALEAMAQAAAMLAEAPVRTTTDLTMAAPVMLPAGTMGSAVVIRICAVRAGDTVTVALRSSNSDFAFDHCLARFSEEPETARRSDAGNAGSRAVRHGPKARIEGADLYRQVCFQTGRFRRLTAVHPDGSRAANAVAYGPDRLPWFGADWPISDRPERGLVLGSPGLNDAALQLIQACVPHRRLTLAGCESVTVSGRLPIGLVTLRVTEVDADLPRGEPQQSESVWDAEIADATGQPLVTWHRLRMRAAGPLPQPGPWPVPLLGSYLERAAGELGLGPGLRVEVSLDNLMSPDGRPADDRFAMQDGPARLALRAEATGPASAGCRAASLADVEMAPGVPRSGAGWLALLRGLPPRLSHLGAPLPVPGACQPAVSMAAAQAAAAQAAALGSCAGELVPPDLTAEVRHIVEVDWLLLRTGDARIACTVLDVADLGQTAFALMTGVLSADEGAAETKEPAATGRPGKAFARRATGRRAGVIAAQTRITAP